MSKIEIEWPERYRDSERRSAVYALRVAGWHALADALRGATLPEPPRQEGIWIVRSGDDPHVLLRRWRAGTWFFVGGSKSLYQDWTPIKFVGELS